jgi:chromate reductase
MTTSPAPAVEPVHILGISGSLRKGSYNTALLRAAAEMLPEAVTLSIADLSPIPLYNQDLMTDRFPEPVEELRGRIAQADALLFATPEYNYSLPAVLKNAVDWASRPPSQPLAGKPAAIMGASPGMLGTARSQMHLRQVFVFVDVHPINKPEVLVARAHEKFDADGKLTDEATRKHVRQLLESLVAWTRRLRGR